MTSNHHPHSTTTRRRTTAPRDDSSFRGYLDELASRPISDSRIDRDAHPSPRHRRATDDLGAARAHRRDRAGGSGAATRRSPAAYWPRPSPTASSSGCSRWRWCSVAGPRALRQPLTPPRALDLGVSGYVCPVGVEPRPVRAAGSGASRSSSRARSCSCTSPTSCCGPCARSRPFPGACACARCARPARQTCCCSSACRSRCVVGLDTDQQDCRGSSLSRSACCWRRLAADRPGVRGDDLDGAAAEPRQRAGPRLSPGRSWSTRRTRSCICWRRSSWSPGWPTSRRPTACSASPRGMLFLMFVFGRVIELAFSLNAVLDEQRRAVACPPQPQPLTGMTTGAPRGPRCVCVRRAGVPVGGPTSSRPCRPCRPCSGTSSAAAGAATALPGSRRPVLRW